MFYIVLHCFTLFDIVLHRFTLFDIVLHRFTSFYIVFRRFTLFYMFHIVLHGYIVLHSFYIVSHGFTLCYIVFHCFTSFYIVLHFFTSFYIVLHRFTLFLHCFTLFYHRHVEAPTTSTVSKYPATHRVPVSRPRLRVATRPRAHDVRQHGAPAKWRDGEMSTQPTSAALQHMVSIVALESECVEFLNAMYP